MGKVLARVLWGMGGLVLAVAMVLLASYWWPASAVQKRALAALEAPQSRPGSNAYATVALLGVQGMTPQQRQARVDEHARQFEQWYVTHYVPHFGKGEEAGELGVMPPQLLSEAEMPPAADAMLCSLGKGAECLDAVRQQPEAIAAALVPQAAVLAQMDELAAHGHYHSPLRQMEATPWPSPRSLRVPLSAHALAFVQGDGQRALAGVCRDAGIGRMLIAQGDNLLTTMVGAGVLKGNAELFAAMLAELPADAPLPGNCAVAFAPLSPDEAGICTGMRGEFAMMRNLAELMEKRIESKSDARYANIFYNGKKTLAEQAEVLGAPCLPEARQTIAEDRKWVATPAKEHSWWRLECLTNSVGCILSSISGPDFGKYAHVLQDTGARLRLLQATLWLREHAIVQDTATPLAERLKQLPAEMRGAQRPITVSTDGTALETPAYAEDATTLRMPLPQALLHR